MSRAPGAPPWRVLVVDDAEDIRALIALYLTKAGLGVLTAGDGREGLAIALRERPDLVLMDMYMPQMNGVDAVAALRRAGFDAPVIALTAEIGGGALRAMLDAGCDARVHKPVDRARFLRCVLEHLERRAGVRA